MSSMSLRASWSRFIFLVSISLILTGARVTAQEEEIPNLPIVFGTWERLTPNIVLPDGYDSTNTPSIGARGPVGRCDMNLLTNTASGKFHFFGGLSAKGVLGDSWTLDPSTHPPTWTYRPDSSASPSGLPRVGAAVELLPDFDQLLVFGGSSVHYLDDILSYDLQTSSWTTIVNASQTNHGNPGPFARAYTGWIRTTESAQVNSTTNSTFYELVLYGGSGDSASIGTAFDMDQDDLWSYIYTRHDDGTFTGEWIQREARICVSEEELCTDAKPATERYTNVGSAMAALDAALGQATFRPSEVMTLLANLREISSNLSAATQDAITAWNGLPASEQTNDPATCTTKCYQESVDTAVYPVHPPRLEGHRVSKLNDHTLVFFGGYQCLEGGLQFYGGEECYSSDLWLLDLASYNWTRIARPVIDPDASDVPPREKRRHDYWAPPRAYHSQFMYEGRLWVYGGGFKPWGELMTYYNDFNVFDFDLMEWVYTDVRGSLPPRHWSMGMSVLGENADIGYLYGGCTDNDIFDDQLYGFRFNQLVGPENIFISGPGVEQNLTAGTSTWFLIEARENIDHHESLHADRIESMARSRRATSRPTAPLRSLAHSRVASHDVHTGSPKSRVATSRSVTSRRSLTVIDSVPSPTVTDPTHPIYPGRPQAKHHEPGDLLPWATNLVFSVQLINENRGLVRANINELGGGRYNVSYTLKKGYNFHLYIRMGTDPTPLDVPSSQITLQPQSPSSSYVYLQTTPGIKGDQVKMTMILYDALANRLHSGGHIVGAHYPIGEGEDSSSAALYPPASTGQHTLRLAIVPLDTDQRPPASASQIQALPPIQDIVDNGDGSYTIAYTIPDGSFTHYSIYLYFDSALFESGNTAIPKTEIAYDQSVINPNLKVAAYVLTSICMAIVIGYMIVLTKHSEARVVKASSYFFLMTLCSGVLLCFIAAFLLSVTNDHTCRAYPIILGFGYDLLIGSLFVKSQRIMSIFTTKKLQVMNLSNARTGIPIIVLLIAELIFAIIWLAVDPMHRVGEPNVNNPYQTYEHCDCDHKDGWVAFTIIEKALLMIYGIYLATKTRNVPKAYNESRLMAFSLYNIAFVVLIGILLIYLTQSDHDVNTPYFTQVFVILWCCMWTCSSLIVPRIYYIMYPPGADFFSAAKKSGLSGGHSTLSRKNTATDLNRPISASIAAVSRPESGSIAAVRKPTTVGVPPSSSSSSSASGNGVELQPISRPPTVSVARVAAPSLIARPAAPPTPTGPVKLPRRVSLVDIDHHLPPAVDVASLAESGMKEHVEIERRTSKINMGSSLLASGMGSSSTPPDTPPTNEGQEPIDSSQIQPGFEQPPAPVEPFPSQIASPSNATHAEEENNDASPPPPPPMPAALNQPSFQPPPPPGEPDEEDDDIEELINAGTPATPIYPASQPPPPSDADYEY